MAIPHCSLGWSSFRQACVVCHGPGSLALERSVLSQVGKIFTAGFHVQKWRFGSDHFPFFSWVTCRICRFNLPGCTLMGVPFWRHFWVDDFPFSQVKYASFVEGISSLDISCRYFNACISAASDSRSSSAQWCAEGKVRASFPMQRITKSVAKSKAWSASM